MVRAHQAIFDRHLAGGEVDQATVDEVRGDPARPLFVQVDEFDLDPRQAADARTDRHPARMRVFLVHVGEACVLERLAGGVDSVDDEGIDLALDLVIDPFVGIESILMIAWTLPRPRSWPSGR